VTWEGRGIFEVSSADPDSATPVWVDLTLYVNDVVSTPTLTTGRQNDLDQSEPAELQVVLNNADDRFTFGNTSSPYAAWWGPGRKCRYREVIAGTTVPLFVGYLQMPTEGLVTAGIDQRVGISALDRLGRLGSAEPFVSTIGAHVLGSAVAGTLHSYYPLLDLTTNDASGNNRLPLRSVLHSTAGGNNDSPNLLQLAAGVGPPGDDLRPPLWQPTYEPVTGSIVANREFRASALPLFSTFGFEQLAITFWVRPLRIGGSGGFTRYPLRLTTVGGAITIGINESVGLWAVSIADVGWSVAFTGPVLAWDVMALVSLRINLITNAVEFRVRSELTTAAVVGSPPFSVDPTTIAVGDSFWGSICQLQFYLGTAASWDGSFHAAQYALGLNGLERQATGDRIRTIAQYAGVPAGELTQVDQGSSIMQRASLAGLTPLEAMREAESTEQGLLYVDGSGGTVFKDRVRLYNI
jgi:hypothetical protein